MLTKYWQTTKAGWASGFTYRLNFVMWRVRMFIQLLAIYFLWWVVTSRRPEPFGYQQSVLISYILFAAFARSLVFSSRSTDAQTEIANGELSNYLIKPVNYFGYWFARDVADKVLNLLFSLLEIGLLIFLLKPPLFIQTQPFYLLSAGVCLLLAMILYFFFSFLISMSTFWYAEANGWPQRFLVFTLLEFLAGGLFPLDILPQKLYQILSFLPPTLFIFTPAQIYLGRYSLVQIAQSFGLLIGWLIILGLFSRWLWRRGVKHYEAWGR